MIRLILISLFSTMGLFAFQVAQPEECHQISEQTHDYIRFDNVSVELRGAITNNDIPVIRDLTMYFIQTRDMDNDGLIGYGLATEADAFSDGSVNPANHEYTVTNGAVLGELARALQLDIWTPDEYEAIEDTIYQVTQAVNDTTWDERGYYRYSHAPTDTHHVLNVNVIWIGTQQYILNNTNIGTQSERQLWQERNTRGIMAMLYIMERNPLTVYRTGAGGLNDLNHQAAQLRYLEVYRDNGGWLPYSVQDALDSIYEYQHGDSWYVRPDYQQCLANTWHVEYTINSFTQ